MSKLLLFLFISVVGSFYGQSQYEKEFAYINTKGEVVFKLSAKYAYGFENRRAEIAKYTIEGNEAFYRRGFIDTKGNIVIPCKYDKVYDFNSTATFVRKPNAKKYNLIDRDGKELTNVLFDKPGYFFEGMASFKENDKMGFVDSTGTIRIKANYIGASSFSEGLVCVMPYDATSEKYGFIDKNGNVVIPYQYKQAGFTSFENGIARVKIGGKAALINKKGEVVVQTKFSTVSGVSEDLMMVAQGSSYNDFGYADFSGNFVIKGPYYSVKPFEGGVAVVSKARDKQGLIDKTGKVIIPLEHETVYNNILESNYVATLNGRDWKYYTIDGATFTKENVAWLGNANGTELIPFKDASTEKYGFLNKKGELVIPAKFKSAKEFSVDGLALVELADNETYQQGEIITSTPVSTELKWQTLHFRADNPPFSVDAPAEMKREMNPDKTGVNYTYQTSHDGKGYAIVINSFNDGVPSSIKLTDIAEKFKTRMVAEITDSQTDNRLLSKEGYRYTMMKDGKRIAYLVLKDANQLYQVIFLNNAADQCAEENKFIDSFVLEK